MLDFSFAYIYNDIITYITTDNISRIGGGKMPIKAIKRSSVNFQVFEQMKNMIISQEWPTSSKIPSENELTKMFGVSRISIREALQKLIILDLIETRHGEGTYVKELSSAMHLNSLIPMFVLEKPDIMQILEFRKIIEVGSVKLAAEKCTDEDIELLQQIFDKMLKSKDDYKKHSIEDLNFHFQIAKMTKNLFLEKVYFIIKDVLKNVMEDVVSILGYSRGIYYHEKLLAALKDKDVELSKDIMEKHLNNTIESIKKMFKEKPNTSINSDK